MTAHRWISAPLAAVAAALLLAASGCETTWQVDSYEPAGAGLAGKRTFAWTGGELGTVAAVDPDGRRIDRPAHPGRGRRRFRAQGLHAGRGRQVGRHAGQLPGRRQPQGGHLRAAALQRTAAGRRADAEQSAAAGRVRAAARADGPRRHGGRLRRRAGDGAPAVARRNHRRDAADVQRERDPHRGARWRAPSSRSFRSESRAPESGLSVGVSVGPTRPRVSDRRSRARCPAST